MRYMIFISLIWIAWRVTSIGLSEHYIRQSADRPEAIDQALAWQKRSQALYLKAIQIKEQDVQKAIALLQQSIVMNPANGKAVIELALLWQSEQPEKADQLAEKAVQLMPSNAQVRIKAAEYWLKKQAWSKSLQNWHAVLLNQPQLQNKIFPVLQQFAEIDILRPYLKSYVNADWWSDFIIYMSQKSVHLSAVLALAHFKPLEEAARNALIERLMQEKKWAQAYITWVSGLSKRQKYYLGNVYNGGFELPISNQGFDWRIRSDKVAFIRRQPTSGDFGKKALHITLYDKEALFNHLSQYILLSPGHYTWQARVKLDFLKGRKGLVWTIRCADSDQIIMQSPPLIGVSGWHWLRLNFDVPQDCPAQIMSLESTGRHVFDHKLSGDIWFDQILIKKQ